MKYLVVLWPSSLRTDDLLRQSCSSPAVRPWGYDLLFLRAAQVPTAVIALRMYRCLGPAADLLAQTVTPMATAESTVAPASGERRATGMHLLSMGVPTSGGEDLGGQDN